MDADTSNRLKATLRAQQEGVPVEEVLARAPEGRQPATSPAADHQQWQIRAAAKLAEAPLEDLPQLMGLKPDEDLALVYGMALGEARAHIKGLLDIITALAGNGQS